MGQIDASDFDAKNQNITQTGLEQMFYSKQRGCKTGRLIIDGNSVYEIDEECIRQRGMQIRPEPENETPGP